MRRNYRESRGISPFTVGMIANYATLLAVIAIISLHQPTPSSGENPSSTPTATATPTEVKPTSTPTTLPIIIPIEQTSRARESIIAQSPSGTIFRKLG